MDELRARVSSLRADPARTVLAFDFDGTLSPVVDDPAAARPLAGVPSLLEELASTYRRVAVLSGRPVEFLAHHLPEAVDLSGLYGLESRIDGVSAEHEEASRWRPVVGDASARAHDAARSGGPLEGMRVESKGLSITLHVRTAPDLADQVNGFAAEVGAELGLEVRPAKMSVELHPPIRADKGTALHGLVVGAAGVVFVGDDVGDVPAFDALAELADPRRSSGAVETLGIAVGSPELPEALRRRADLVLVDQAAVTELLEALLP